MWFVILVGVPALIGFVLFLNAMKSAQDLMPSLIEKMSAVSAQPSQIFSRDGVLLYQVSPEFRLPIDDIKAVPASVTNAVLAAEDRRFYEHQGVDVIAMGRTLFVDIRDQRLSQGGSTLTMQLAKRLSSKGQKTFSRKLQDMAIAVQLERYYTKDQILKLYLNEVYFGSGAYGIQAAAEVYFGKTLKQLTVAEAAMLARCVRKPSEDNPYANLGRAIENRNTVLETMVSEGMIDNNTYEKARLEQPKLRARSFGSGARKFHAPYFVDDVLATLKRDHPEIDLNKGGYRIETTIDMAVQGAAEQAAQSVVRENRDKNVRTAAFVVMTKDGQILAEVGGVDYKREQFNAVTSGAMQPGSSFKPFVYATAFAEHTLSRSDTLSNERLSVPDGQGGYWMPKNSAGHYGGNVPLETAFKMSINIPAVRALETVGVSKVLDYARSVFGLHIGDTQVGESLALGACEVNPLQMAEAYSVFMTGGDRVTPYPIQQIVGPDKSIIAAYDPKIVRGVLSENVCQDIDALMRAVVESGTGTRANTVPDARGKTGTTSDNKDAWFCGYADGVVGIGWVANEYRDARGRKVKGEMRGIFGGNTTVNLWTPIMLIAQKKYGHRFDTGPKTKPASDAFSGPDPANEPLDPAVSPDAKKVDLTPGDPNVVAPPPGGATDTTTPGTDPALAAPGRTVVEPPPLPDVKVEEPKPRDRPKSKPPPAAIEYVTVDVCADTNLRANMYCTEVISKRFRKGTEPKRVCRLHHG